MTQFRTCVGCKYKPSCEHLKDLKEHISGFGVTLLKHRCKFRQPLFNAGDAVLVRTRACSNNSCEGEEPPIAIFRGHFIEQYDTRAIAFIAPNSPSVYDDEPYPFEPFPNGRGFVKVPLSRIEADPEREPVQIQYCAQCMQRTTFVDECYCVAPRSQFQQARVV